MSRANDLDSFVVPPSIRLLFDNNQLELIKTLCLLFSLYLNSNRRFNKLPDIVFYYSLVNFDMLKIIKSNEDTIDASRNLYYRFQEKINQIILELINLGFVEIKGEITSNTNSLGVRLTREGFEFVKDLGIDYFYKLINEYSSVIDMVDNNTKNRNLIKGVSK